MEDNIYRSTRPFIGETVQAHYQQLSEPMYQHNCFNEALTKRLTPEEVLDQARFEPCYSDCERALPSLDRMNAICRIFYCVFPTVDFVLLEQKLSTMIREGYSTRNPIREHWKKQLKKMFPGKNFKDLLPTVSHRATGFSIIGPSGSGKSTLIECLLGLSPQVIEHVDYQGTPFDRKQVVWLKINAPFDGNPRGLCISFFDALDSIMGTNNLSKIMRGRKSVDELIILMAREIVKFGVGILVIDEIQRLELDKSGGAEKLLEFFKELTITFGIPVILVGTREVSELFRKRKLATARRFSGRGSHLIGNFANNTEWKVFLQKLWKYQWTATATPLTDKMSDAMYRYSMGIVDIAVKLYALCQWEAICGGEDETITIETLDYVYQTYFKSVLPILDALRRGDKEALKKYDDAWLSKEQIDDIRRQKQHELVVCGTLNTLANQQSSAVSTGDVVEDPEVRIASLLITAGHSRNKAQLYAKAAVKRFHGDTEMHNARAEAFRLAALGEIPADNISPPKKQSAKKQAVVEQVEFLSNDLREHARVAKVQGRDIYEVLKDNNLIKSPTEFLEAAHA